HVSPALRERLIVTQGLRRLQGPEAVSLGGDGDVGGIVGGDLNEDAGGWSALVELSGGVKEAGTEADRGCHPELVAYRRAQLGERPPPPGGRRHIHVERHV